MHRQRDHTPDLARSAELKRFVATTAYINVGASKLVRMLTQRVHVPNNWVIGFWVIVIVVKDSKGFG